MCCAMSLSFIDFDAVNCANRKYVGDLNVDTCGEFFEYYNNNYNE